MKSKRIKFPVLSESAALKTHQHNAKLKHIIDRKGYKNYRFLQNKLYLLDDEVIYSVDTVTFDHHSYNWLGLCDSFEVSIWNNQPVVVTTQIEEDNTYYRLYRIHNLETRELVQMTHGDYLQAFHINERSIVIKQWGYALYHINSDGNQNEILLPKPAAVFRLKHTDDYILFKAGINKWVCLDIRTKQNIYELTHLTSIIYADKDEILGFSTISDVEIMFKKFNIHDGTLLSYWVIDRKFTYEEKSYELVLSCLYNNHVFEDLSRGSIDLFYKFNGILLSGKYDLDSRSFKPGFDGLPVDYPMGSPLEPVILNRSGFALGNSHVFFFFREGLEIHQSSTRFISRKIDDFLIRTTPDDFIQIVKTSPTKWNDLDFKATISSVTVKESDFVCNFEEAGGVIQSIESGEKFFSLDANGVFRSRDVKTLKVDFQYRTNQNGKIAPQGIAFYEGNIMLVYALTDYSYSGVGRIVHLKVSHVGCEVEKILEISANRRLDSMCLTSRGRSFYYTVNNRVGKGCIETGKMESEIEVTDRDFSAITSKEDKVLLATKGGTIYILDEELRIKHSMKCQATEITNVLCRGSWIVTGDEHGTIRIFDEDLNLQNELVYHTAAVTRLRFVNVPGVTWLVSSSKDGRLVFWDTIQCKPIIEYLAMGNIFLFQMCREQKPRWFWTNDPRIVEVSEQSNIGNRVLDLKDPRREEYLRIYNNRKMIIKCITDPVGYEEARNIYEKVETEHSEQQRLEYKLLSRSPETGM